MTISIRLTAALLAGLGVAACSSVKTWTRPEYPTADKKSVLRLVVVPATNSTPEVTALAGQIAKRYANHHRDFVVREVVSATVTPCVDDVEGVLQVELDLKPGDSTDIRGRAELLRCDGQNLVWFAEHDGSYPATDPNLTELTTIYAREIDPSVTPFVSPVFQTVRRLLDRLPTPEMPNDDYVIEKIELD